MGTVRDVVVIGAGPAGLHVAYRLAAAGLDIVLLEAQARIGERAICSGVIGEEAFARFALPTRPVLTNIHCIEAISPGGRKLQHGTDTPLARVVNKGELNRALGERALATGVEIRLGRCVQSFEREREGVVARFCSAERGSEMLKARVAIIASGVNCSLNRDFGLARPREFLRAIQADVTLPNGNKSAPTRVYVGRCIAPGAFGWEIPLGNGHARVGLMSTRDPKPYFRALLSRIAPTVEASQLNICQKGIAQAPVGRCAADRILTVGEAAGHVKTSTGGGIYYGLLSAEFAAEVVLRAFQKREFTTHAFSDFERYWRTTFGKELLVGYLVRKLASYLRDSQIERIFEAAKASNLLVRLDGRLKFDWHHEALLATLRSLLALPGGLGDG
ncbi:MAG: geranylgeranyl reductase family protein [Terriglobia bacterium]